MIKPDSSVEEIPNGHSQDNRRASANERTWTSISRLNLPISKDDNKGKIKCIAEHPALNEELETETSLIIHCKYLFSAVHETLHDINHIRFLLHLKQFLFTNLGHKEKHSTSKVNIN